MNVRSLSNALSLIAPRSKRRIAERSTTFFVPTLRTLFVFAWALLCALPPPAMAQWPRQTIDDSLDGADGLRIRRTGKERWDLVAGWEESGKVRLYHSPAPDEIHSPWPFDAVGNTPSCEDALFVELTGKGAEILACCEGREQALWHFRRAAQSRQLTITQDDLAKHTWHPSRLTGGDFANGLKTRWMTAAAIGKHQVAVASKDPSGLVGLLRWEADADLFSLKRLARASWVMSLEPVDFDGDGDMDIVYSDRKGEQSGVYWLEQRSASEWESHLLGAANQEVMFLDLVRPGAFEQAAEPRKDVPAGYEIVVATKPNQVLHIRRCGNGHWETSNLLQFPLEQFGTAKSVAAADMDGDGVQDLIYSCEHADAPKSGVVLARQSAGTWKLQSISGPEGIKFDDLHLIDIDGDKDLDVLTCEERHAGRGLGIIWYENCLVE